jgi:uncharacterized membrane protein
MLRIAARSPILLILIFLISTCLSIFLNISFFRQILGLVFLSFVPGVLILCILKPDKLGLTEMFVLSMGLSISFVMFSGILINTIYPIFDYETPLSITSLVISLTMALLILAIFADLRGGFSFLVNRDYPKLDIKDKTLFLILPIFPILSVLGMHLMNTTDNNTMLMALLFLIPGYVIFIAISHNQIPEKVYPPIIFLISISLVLLMGMRSSHIIGADVHNEYYIFLQTLSNERWIVLSHNILDSCLCISVLPTIYQSFLNINPEYLFKILYPFLFSIGPLVVYIISKKYIDSSYAFLASVFFMSQLTFLGTAMSPRTTVGILFFALSVMVLFHNGLDKVIKRLFFMIFALSCIFSHYSTTYIFFIVLFITFIGMQITQNIFSSQRGPTISNNPLSGLVKSQDATFDAPRYLPKSHITIGIVVLFFIVLFFWYSLVTVEAFDSGVGFFVDTLGSLQDFFIVEARGESVSSAFGSGLSDKVMPFG